MDNRDVLLIQDNEDDTFSWLVPELDAAGTCSTAEEALQEALGVIADNPTVSKITPQDEARVAAIGKRVAILRAELTTLEQEQESLKKIIPVVAHELLEEVTIVEKATTWLFVDYPLEKYLGDVKTVGFYPQRDRDGDGDMDIAPSLYSFKKIKDVPPLEPVEDDPPEEE